MTQYLKFIYLLLFTVSFSTITLAQTWSAKADLPEGREGAVCFSINGKVYWGGGTSISQTSVSSDFYEYDPATDTWTQKNNMPEERMWGISFSINGKGYVGLGRKSGGVTQSYLKTLYEYDPATDTWALKADMPQPNQNDGLVQSSVFVANNKAYVLGGYDENFSPFGTLYEYDPTTDTWTQKSNYPLTINNNNFVKSPFVFCVDDKGYICSGEVRKASGPGTEWTKKSFEYDPATDTWTPIADFIGTPRSHGVAIGINDKGYCGMGYHKDVNFQNVFYKDMYTYKPATDTWTKMSNDFPGAARVWPVATAINNKAFIGGGSEHQSAYKKDWQELELSVSVSNTITAQQQLQTYPNPATNAVYIKAKEGYNSYHIYSLDGRKLAHGSINNNKINTEKIPTGQYIIELKNNMQAQRGLITISK